MNEACDTWLATEEKRWNIDGVVRIGRSSSNEVVLDHAGVSRRHALIQEQIGGQYQLIDLGSSNGTFVNSQPVVQATTLRNGDTIRIGSNTEIVFHCERSSPQASFGSLSGPTLKELHYGQYWLLVADVAGFTTLSRAMAPDHLAKSVGDWFAETRRLVENASGAIYKYLGDGWLGGWPDSESAAQSILQCLEDLAELQCRTEFSFRLALHHAEVTIAGTTGKLDLVGTEVNRCFRMEKLAAELGQFVLLSDATFLALGEPTNFQPLGKHALKGFEQDLTYHGWLTKT